MKCHDKAEGESFFLRRVYLNSGGYDTSGAYWGIGAPLYEVWNSAENFHLRASSWELAKAKFLEKHPNAKFYS